MPIPGAGAIHEHGGEESNVGCGLDRLRRRGRGRRGHTARAARARRHGGVVDCGLMRPHNRALGGIVVAHRWRRARAPLRRSAPHLLHVRRPPARSPRASRPVEYHGMLAVAADRLFRVAVPRRRRIIVVDVNLLGLRTIHGRVSLSGSRPAGARASAANLVQGVEYITRRFVHCGSGDADELVLAYAPRRRATAAHPRRWRADGGHIQPVEPMRPRLDNGTRATLRAGTVLGLKQMARRLAHLVDFCEKRTKLSREHALLVVCRLKNCDD